MGERSTDRQIALRMVQLAFEMAQMAFKKAPMVFKIEYAQMVLKMV